MLIEGMYGGGGRRGDVVEEEARTENVSPWWIHQSATKVARNESAYEERTEETGSKTWAFNFRKPNKSFRRMRF